MKIATVTAVVCTYNRCTSLQDTLHSLVTQRVSPGVALDILVIDNNSTDETKQVVDRWTTQSAWPVRYVVEPSQGIAYARNRGLLSAQGDIVAYIDDDAIADPRWIESLVACFNATDADMVGGKIAPLWLTARPGWLADDLMGPITAFDLGSARRQCTKTQEAFLTTNCALRRASATRFGIFDVTLGRRGTRWVGGEDFELFIRWLKQGATIVYEPTARVQHKIGPERVSPHFYRRWFEDVGYTQAHQLDWKWHYRLSIVPVWRWKKLTEAAVNYLRTRAGRSTDELKLQAELWWLFQRSFLKERIDHWFGKRACHFADAT